jgi:hypothetical protein
VKGGGQMGMRPPPAASWDENAIITECAQENGHLQSPVLSVCYLLYSEKAVHRTARVTPFAPDHSPHSTQGTFLTESWEYEQIQINLDD